MASGWEGPIIDHIKLGFGGAVTITGEVMPDILNSFLEEVIFAQFQQKAVLLAYFKAACKVIE